jgi:hypothetical protein
MDEEGVQSDNSIANYIFKGFPTFLFLVCCWILVASLQDL